MVALLLAGGVDAPGAEAATKARAVNAPLAVTTDVSASPAQKRAARARRTRAALKRCLKRARKVRKARHRAARIRRCRKAARRTRPAKRAPKPASPAPSTPRSTNTSAQPVNEPAPRPAALGADMFGIAVGGAFQNQDAATVTRDLDAQRAIGSRWIRIDLNWAQIQGRGPSSYDWAPIDRVVQGATARGMKVLGTLVYAPEWARPPGTGARYVPDPARFAEFAAAAVRHYAPLGVHAFEIWNEPNVAAFWEPGPDVAAYTRLLKAAYPAIKSADPQATVVTGGMSPAATNGVDIAPVDFVNGIYAHGGAGSFDAVGHHPYCWPANPGDAESWSPWHQMQGTSPSIRSAMTANGDGHKKIWATEFGAPTNGPPGSFVGEDAQGQMIARAHSLWKTYEWAGPMFTYSGRDLGTDTASRENFFGLFRNDFSPKPAAAAFQIATNGG